MHGLKQLIQYHTRVTCSTSILIDHILASFPSGVSQKGVIKVGLSDHQLIFCTVLKNFLYSIFFVSVLNLKLVVFTSTSTFVY